jgi:hypothetical protein
VEGLKLWVLHPEVATRSCDECKRFVFDDNGKKMMRGGNPVPRQPGANPPCRTCPKISPENEKNCTLSEKNWKTIQLWYQSKATGGNVPLDDIARENLGLVQYVMDAVSTVENAKATMMAMAPLMVK